MFSFEMKGVDSLTEKLNRLETLAKQKQLTTNALFFASKPMLQEIKRNAPRAEKSYYRYRKHGRKKVRPGNLRRSITRKRLKDQTNASVAIYVKSRAFYYRFIEYGTPTMMATPFLRPAFDQNKHLFVELFQQRYREHVRDAIAKRISRVDADVSE